MGERATEVLTKVGGCCGEEHRMGRGDEDDGFRKGVG